MSKTIPASADPAPASDQLSAGGGYRGDVQPDPVTPATRQDPDVDPRLLRAFLAVAEEGHFGRAAARLRLAQPALSRQVQQLERALGVELFTRGPAGAELTEVGRLVRPEAARALAQNQRLVRTARAHAGAPGPALTVAAPMPAPPGGLLAAAIRLFRVLHADVALAVVELDDDEQATALAEGRVDAALTWERPVRPGLTAEVLLTEPTVALLPAGHPLAGAASFPVAGFTDGPLLFPVAERSHCWAQLDTLAGSAGVRLDPIPTAPSAVTDLVAAGLGISAVPGSFGSSGRSDVAFVPVPGLVGEMSVLWRDDESAVLVLDFLDACRAAARDRLSGPPAPVG